MRTLFHVSSSANRASILSHGLDWRLMASARGIAGSTAAEVEGVFLCTEESDVDWFINMNNTGGPVDVWRVRGVRLGELVESGNGFDYLPRPVPAKDVSLDRTDIPVASRIQAGPRGSTAYASTLTIVFDDPSTENNPTDGEGIDT